MHSFQHKENAGGGGNIMLNVFKLIMHTLLMIYKLVISTTYSYGMLSYYHQLNKESNSGIVSMIKFDMQTASI
jgi:hypothetical protein